MSTQKDHLGPAALGRLAELTHHRWMLPVLALCDRAEGGGHKHVTFLNRLGISRDSLGRTLAAGVGSGWLMNNPGVGHPMRPEYILTVQGRALAPHARRVVAALERLELEDEGLNKWSLPLLAALASGGRDGLRFSEIARLLPETTSRAVSLSLRELEAAGMIHRRVLETYPPTAMYGLARRAARLAAAARAMARAIGPRFRGARPDPGGGMTSRRAASA